MPRNATATAMLAAVVDRLARWLPQSAEPAEAPHAWAGGDSGWHTSSFELRQGLEVIEHHHDAAAPRPTFADTLPAFHAPAARRA